MVNGEMVWLLTQRRWAVLTHLGAHYSTVEWVENGIEYEDIIENDDYEFLEDRAFEFEPDDD
jgi:hypothetical protein